MSTEALHASGEIQTAPEFSKTTPEAAYNDLLELSIEEGFEQMCEDRDLRARDIGSADYCEALATYGAAKADQDRAMGRPEHEVILTELFSATPDALYKQAALNGGTASGEARQTALETVSAYNGLVRAAAEATPGLRASQLQANLLNAANSTVRDKAVMRGAADSLRSIVRGAQHEVAFSQILETAGRQHYSASVAEDLKGIDIISPRPDGRGNDLIDVKASLHAVQKEGRTEAPYYRHRDGRYTMYSMVRDSELNDGFAVPPAAAQERAGLVHQILNGYGPAGRPRSA